ncbi:MAG: putative transcriptional regulator [Haloarculaceae archaeon]|jgi:predicted transcriptional regulator
MDESQLRALSWIVEQYDTQEAPVTPADVTDHFQSDIDAVRSCFDNLESKCLLKRLDGGYRPTVTAQELLDLDIDDDTVLILDTEPCE